MPPDSPFFSGGLFLSRQKFVINDIFCNLSETKQNKVKTKDKTRYALSRTWDVIGFLLGITTAAFGATVGWKWGGNIAAYADSQGYHIFGIIARIAMAQAVAFGFGFAIDHLKILIARSANIEIATGWKELTTRYRAFVILSVVAYLFLLGLSGSLTYWTGDELGKDLYAPPTPTNIDSIVLVLSEAVSSQDKINTSQLKEASQSIKAAKTQGAAKVKAAIRAGGGNFSTLWRNGNEWVRKAPETKKAREAVYQAQADSATLVDKVTEEMQQIRLGALASTQSIASIRDSVGVAETATRARILANWAESQDRFGTTVLVTDGALMVSDLLLFILLAMVGGYMPKRYRKHTIAGTVSDISFKIESNIIGWMRKTFALEDSQRWEAPDNVLPTSDTSIPEKDSTPKPAPTAQELTDKKDKDSSEPLSDNTFPTIEYRVKVVGDTVEMDGEKWADMSDFAGAAQKWYIRQFPKTPSHKGSKFPATQAKNKAKWIAAKAVLEDRYIITEDGKTVSIIPKNKFSL